MSRTMNLFKGAVAASCLALAACGGSDSAESQASSATDAAAATVLKASPAIGISPNGTNIPAAKQIIDSQGKRWTVAAGVIYVNGQLAGYSANVTLLIYSSNSIYQQNTAGGWWSWNGSTWISTTDPRETVSAGGANIPGMPQLVDGGGNIWAISGGVVYQNGALAGYSNRVIRLVYDNNLIYQENAAGGWWSWISNTWQWTADPLSVVASANGTTVPSVKQIIDGNGNVWTVSGGVVYENGGLAGFSAGVTQLVYDNGLVYQENIHGGWWSWTDGNWVSGNDPVASTAAPQPTPAPTPTTGSATLSWTAPTQNTDGTPLSDLAGYTIYYGTTAGAMSQTIRVPNPGAITYVVDNLSAGTYYFSIAAYSADGAQSTQSTIGSTTIL